MKTTPLLIFYLILISGTLQSQEIKTLEHSICINFLQIKEQANYGLVFKGPGLGYAFSRNWKNDRKIINYEGRLALNTLMSREILAASINLVPVRFDYLFKTGGKGKVYIGPYAVMEYNYELYPDLQSGYSYWMTHYSIGGAVTYTFGIKNHRFDLDLHTTLIGVSSRQPVYDDPYFFDLSPKYIAEFVHQDFKFGSWDRYNNTEFEARWTPHAASRLAYAYSFQYYRYGNEPFLTMINHSVKLIFLPKKK